MKTLRVGILGAGYMGRLHGRNLVRQRGVVVGAVCSRPIETAQVLSRELTGGRAACYDDFDRLLGERRLDALYVCLPPFAHEGQVQAAARRGIHLFLEKPIAMTVAQGASMVRAIEKAGIVSQVGYHMRWAAPIRRLKALIDGGGAGRPTLLQARYFCNALHGPWWRDAAQSGGQVFEQLIHLYDLALHFLGKPVAASGFAANLCHKDVPGYTVEDTSASLVRFAGGAVACIVGSNCAVPMEWRSDLRVVCQKVTAEVPDLDHGTFTFSGGRSSEHFWKTGRKPRVDQVARPVDCYLEETRAFLAAVRRGGPSSVPAREGLEGLRLVSAVLESARDGGRPVRL